MTLASRPPGTGRAVRNEADIVSFIRWVSAPRFSLWRLPHVGVVIGRRHLLARLQLAFYQVSNFLIQVHSRLLRYDRDVCQLSVVN